MGFYSYIGGPNPRRGSKSASGLGPPGVQIWGGGSKSARTPDLWYRDAGARRHSKCNRTKLNPRLALRQRADLFNCQ